MLAGMGVVIGVADRLARNVRPLEQLTWRHGVLFGLAQALALVPGVSRSGSTLTASLFDGWQRAAAARFSFLLGIPAITLAGLVELKAAVEAPANGGLIPMLVGVLVAAVVSWLAIAWLLRFLRDHSTWVFVAYRLLFGVLLLTVFRHFDAGTP